MFSFEVCYHWFKNHKRNMRSLLQNKAYKFRVCKIKSESLPAYTLSFNILNVRSQEEAPSLVS